MEMSYNWCADSRLVDEGSGGVEHSVVAIEEKLQQDVGAESWALGGGQEDRQGALSAEGGVEEFLWQRHQALHGCHAVCPQHASHHASHSTHHITSRSMHHTARITQHASHITQHASHITSRITQHASHSTHHTACITHHT
eukprot:TRINITY_DN18764_c1_g1_i4.p1 TRINITY_DN18764_c1_g1~~TRINITY_DN18764_c1_g1_i4.p1  ORF type:complete len:141 (-),score=30.30 TRINITY_DN18764_c1_g1_i4:68-490(-)